MERRLAGRYDARFPAKFQHSSNHFGTDVFLRDVSQRGLRLTTKKRFLIHDNVSLVVSLPDGQNPLLLSGHVVWTKQRPGNFWEVGLYLEESDILAAQKIMEAVSRIRSVN